MAIQHANFHIHRSVRYKRASSLTWALTLVLAALPWGSSSVAADDDAKRVLSEMFAARNRLNSGSYRLTGTTAVDREGKKPEYPITIRCLSDREKGLVNYQHTQRLPWEEDGVTVEGGKEVTLRFIQRPDCLYLFRGGVGPEAITIREPDFPIDSPILPVDIRALGLTTLPELESSLDFESIVESFVPTNVAECSTSDGVWKIVWKIPTKGPTIVRTLHVDEARGFAPTKLSLVLDSSGGADKPIWGHRCEVTWKEVGDAWVPTSAHFEQTAGTGTTIRDCKIEWERVNEEIESSNFDPKSLGLPGNTLVFDHRTDEPVSVGKLDELP